MSEIVFTKKCERCGAPIPDDFQNLLCFECYNAIVLESELRQKETDAQRKAEILKNPDSPTNPVNTTVNSPLEANLGLPAPQGEAQTKEVAQDASPLKFGILDPNYKENPEQDDKDQILANLAQFIYTHDPAKGRKGKLLWYPTRNMYNFIKNECIKQVQAHAQYDKQIWKPQIVDVGCGSGVGSNILSQEADFVWGIDKNEWSIEFAKEAFTREKNGIYYSSQATFDVFDILKDSRTVLQFDIVVAIEVIEHIYDSIKFLTALKRFAKKDKKGSYKVRGPTQFYISTPNRNSPKIKKDQPENIFHVREYTSQEFHGLLSQHFEQVELFSNKGEPVAVDCVDDIVLARCTFPK